MSPTLLVTVDTEEEFDWGAPFARENHSTSHMAELPRLQDLFDEFSVRPTFAVDYPIAESDECVEMLKTLLDAGACEIGAHLHPWVNPPFEEDATESNSFLCNLPLALQERKLEELSLKIENSFGQKPRSFKAGRYGLDFRLVPRLVELGFKVDASVTAYFDWRDFSGPNYQMYGNQPFWISSMNGEQTHAARILEIPCTIGFSSGDSKLWTNIHDRIPKTILRRTHLLGLLNRAGMLRRVWLTPEEENIGDQLRLMQKLANDENVVFNVTLHSPSIQAGHTPFVRNSQQLLEFMDRLRKILSFAVIELGCQCFTLAEFAAHHGRRDSIDPAMA